MFFLWEAATASSVMASCTITYCESVATKVGGYRIAHAETNKQMKGCYEWKLFRLGIDGRAWFIRSHEGSLGIGASKKKEKKGLF